MTATDYSTYLRIDELLALQQPLTPGADDEMLFIVVHQAYELWFKLVLHELGLARDRLLAGEPWLAAPRLRRAVAVEELLYHQLDVLETMPPDGFLEFRDPLAPASGFQSTQYREIEVLSGAPAPADSGAGGPANLWKALCTSLQLAGPSVAEAPVLEVVPDLAADDVPERVPDPVPDPMEALITIYHDHSDAVRASLHEVCELMVDHDEVSARWRYRHSLMAARQIGRRQGTGGSLGVAYLETTINKRYYPMLWEVRSRL